MLPEAICAACFRDPPLPLCVPAPVNPHQLQRKLQEGAALQQRGKLAEAAAVFSEVRRLAPKNFEACHLGGNVALLRGDPRTAANLYALALQLNPRSATAATCLGVAHWAQGDLPKAEAHLRTAVQLEPKNAEIWNQLATLLSSQGRLDEAIGCHRQSVKLNPRSAQAWHGYGTTLGNQNLAAEALECERRAIAADPKYAPARRGHAIALQKCHRIPEAVREYEWLLAQDPRQLEVQSNRLFALNYLPEQTPASLFAAHQNYGSLLPAPRQPGSFPNARDPDKKLRVAFFSADFREHSVAYFMGPILSHLDRDRFEILIYSDCAKSDGITTRFRSLATVWRDCHSVINSVLEPIVLADAPDIVVDLGGHTGASRLPLLARRLAPLQISYLGYPNTTGAPAMDYRLVDPITDPEGEADQFHTEKLLRFAPTAWTYAPPADAPLPSPPPCLQRGFITFGSFNNFSKVTDDALKVWSDLLQKVPGSRLLLKSIGLTDSGISQQVRQRLREAALPDERVDLLGPTATTAGHLATYSQIDIALDTFPYNGTTTTCEALWMGVPVVTLLGNRHAARVGASLLNAVNHQEWIASNTAGYSQAVEAIAAKTEERATLRTRLREDMARSCLLDHSHQADRFETTLRECWKANSEPGFV